jgi:ATP-dependent Clp protease ATP-binding subunit ClpA
MFERFTEQARRVIFFARYEASQLGSSFIEVEHILLGILREDKTLIGKFFPDPSSIYDSILHEIKLKYDHKAKAPPLIDVPLSSGAKRVLQCAAEFSQHFSHDYIGSEHILLGILNENSTVSQMLRERGWSIDLVARYVQSGNLSSDESDTLPGGEIRAIAGGIPAGEITPKTQEVIRKQLLDQFDSIVSALVGYGVMTPQELIDRITNEQLTKPSITRRFQSLLDLLVSKGVISEEEKQKINLPEN